MPPFSHDIAQEGALFDGMRMIHDGHFDEAAMRARARRGPLSRAQSRPEHRGPESAGGRLRTRARRNCGAPCAAYGADTVTAYMRHVQDNAEEEVRRVIGRAQGRRIRNGDGRRRRSSA